MVHTHTDWHILTHIGTSEKQKPRCVFFPEAHWPAARVTQWSPGEDADISVPDHARMATTCHNHLLVCFLPGWIGLKQSYILNILEKNQTTVANTSINAGKPDLICKLFLWFDCAFFLDKFMFAFRLRVMSCCCPPVSILFNQLYIYIHISLGNLLSCSNQLQ